MSLSQRFLAAARVIVDGDATPAAVQRLETMILDEYYGDEDFENLLYVVSMYVPRSDPQYYDHGDLVKEIERTIALRID